MSDKFNCAKQTSSLVTFLNVLSVGQNLSFIEVEVLPLTSMVGPKNQCNKSKACVPSAPITPPPFSF